MKKIIFYLFMVCLSTMFVSNELKATPGPVKAKSENQAAEARVLENRLQKINSMDVSSLSRSERRALRREVRTIDSRLRALSGGIYISVGALIIILLLLLLF